MKNLEQNWHTRNLNFKKCNDFKLPFLLDVPSIGVRICRYKDASPQLIRRQKMTIIKSKLYDRPKCENLEIITNYKHLQRVKRYSNKYNIKLIIRLFISIYLLLFIIIIIVYYQLFFMYF